MRKYSQHEVEDIAAQMAGDPNQPEQVRAVAAHVKKLRDQITMWYAAYNRVEDQRDELALRVAECVDIAALGLTDVVQPILDEHERARDKF